MGGNKPYPQMLAASSSSTRIRRNSLRRLSIALIAVMLWTVPGEGKASQPSIVLIVIDTLRGDRVGVNGNPHGLTPFLDRLASRGTAFVNAYAPSSWTCPSVASLFTSRLASQHKTVAFKSVLSPHETTLAELLAEQRYLSAGFSANMRLLAANGYAQGFARWDAYLPPPQQAKVRGDRVTAEALKWVDASQRTGSAPLFLYLQYMETHAPYEPPEPYRSRIGRHLGEVDFAAANTTLVNSGYSGGGLSPPQVDALTSLYDGEVAAVDAAVGALLGELEQRGVLSNAIVVVTSDHGEEFGEHGKFLHGATLYQPAIRIPLIIAGPGVPSGGIVSENVSLVDVAPTLLDLLSLPPQTSFEGRSLVPLMPGAEPTGLSGWLSGLLFSQPAPPERGPPTGEVVSELERFGVKWDLRSHARTLISGTDKVILQQRGEAMYFDLAQDPGEKSAQPVTVAGDGPRAVLLRRLEQQHLLLNARAAGSTQTVPLDDATREKLRALGYHP